MSAGLPRRLLVGLALDDPEPDGAGGPAGELDVALAPQDRRCVEQALWWAERTGGELHLVHVIEVERGPSSGVLEAAVATARSEAAARLERVRRAVAARGLRAGISVLQGHAWLALLQEVDRTGSELVVVGPHLRRGLVDTLAHGSTTRRLLRRCPTPVWVVKRQGPAGVQRLLGLVDLSPVSTELVELGDRLHAALGVERMLLHSVSFPADVSLRRLADAEEAIGRYHDDVLGDARSRITALLEGRTPGWSVILGRDWVVRDTPRVVAEQQIDTVLVAGISRPRLGVLQGTTAEKILERIDVSILVVKPSDWVAPPIHRD